MTVDDLHRYWSELNDADRTIVGIIMDTYGTVMAARWLLLLRKTRESEGTREADAGPSPR